MKKYRLVLTLLSALSVGAQWLDAQPISGGSTIRSPATVATSTTAGAGTVTTNGTTAIVGSGTTFKTTLRPGHWLTVSGESSRLLIKAIADDTHLTLGVAASTSAAGLSWSWSACNSGPVVEKSTDAARESYQCHNGLYTPIPTTTSDGVTGTKTFTGTTTANVFSVTLTNSGDHAAGTIEYRIDGPTDGGTGVGTAYSIVRFACASNSGTANCSITTPDAGNRVLKAVAPDQLDEVITVSTSITGMVVTFRVGFTTGANSDFDSGTIRYTVRELYGHTITSL